MHTQLMIPFQINDNRFSDRDLYTKIANEDFVAAVGICVC